MKQPWPWYSSGRSGGGWFVTLNGNQHNLGKHPVGAAKPVKKNGRWNSGLPPSALIEVGDDHRLADPEPLEKMLEACGKGENDDTRP